jgi:hypothetical protein
MTQPVQIARRPHVARVARAIAYLRSDDTTLKGSCNGHAVLVVWTRLLGHGTLGFRRDAESCRQMAVDLVRDLRARGVPVLLNPFSLTVLLPQPHPATVTRFQLACSGGPAHAIVMPNVGDKQVRWFRDAYLAWWEAEGGARDRRRGHERPTIWYLRGELIPRHAFMIGMSSCVPTCRPCSPVAPRSRPVRASSQPRLSPRQPASTASPLGT